MQSKYKVLLMLPVIALVISGCSVGKRELNDLAIVMAVGLDKGKNGQIKITTQIARPGDARGQTGAPSAQTGDAVWSASAEGETLFQAIRNLSTYSSRRVFWAHNFIIVINEKLAKQGIRDIIDFFTRNPELRMRTWVVVTPDQASTVVSTLTGLEVVPGEALDKLFRYTTVSVKAPKTQMLDLQAAYLSDSSQPVLARVKLIDRGVSNKKPGQAGAYEQIELAGAGVFKKDKLVGTLMPGEVSGLLPFIEPLNTRVLILKCPQEKTKKMTVEVKNQKFFITPSLKNNKPFYTISYSTTGSVVESDCPYSIYNIKTEKALKREMENVQKKEIEIVLNKSIKEYQSDFLELGKVFMNKYPSEWRKMERKWEGVFPATEYTIKSKAEIRDAVLLLKPTKQGGGTNR